jgi:hypothetical protein
MSEPYSGWFGLVYGVQHHFQQYFSYIMVVSLLVQETKFKLDLYFDINISVKIFVK